MPRFGYAVFTCNNVYSVMANNIKFYDKTGRCIAWKYLDRWRRIKCIVECTFILMLAFSDYIRVKPGMNDVSFNTYRIDN